jgi:hypothetical protein
LRKRWYWLLFGLALLLPKAQGAVGAYHSTPLDAPEDPNTARALTLTNAVLRRVGEDIYVLGKVTLDKGKRTVSFPATVNMTEGPVEYALVHSSGKVHESVLKTEADPLHVQLAWLLVTPGATNDPAAQMKIPRDLRGPKVHIGVEWTAGNKPFQMPLENLITNTITRAPMSRGPWIYSGSRIVEGTYLAHRDGSIVAIISDPDAMINNPRPGRDDDEIWRPNGAVVPGVGTPVNVTVQLLPERD